MVKKNSYQVKTEPSELIFDDPIFYTDRYEVRRIFTKKGRSKVFQWAWNAIAWWNDRHPNGVIANMMFLSYQMGVYDEGWERDIIAEGKPENWK